MTKRDIQGDNRDSTYSAVSRLSLTGTGTEGDKCPECPACPVCAHAALIAVASPADAYQKGVADVLDLARRTADDLETAGRRPLHHGFAVAALRALASEAAALLKPDSALFSDGSAAHDR